VNGDTIGQWDGVVGHNFDIITPTDAGFVPKAKFLTYFNNRLVTIYTVEGGNIFANRVRWAQNGDFTKWDATTGLGAGFLDVQDDNQEPIRGIGGLYGELTLYTRRSIKHLVPTGTLDPTFVVQTRQRGVGCDAPYSVASTGSMQFFLGYDHNVWMWDGLTATPVGVPIWDELRAIVTADKMETYFGKVFSTREEYWLVLGADVFVFDYIRNAWSRDTLPNLQALGEVEETLNPLRWIDLVGRWNQQTLTWSQFAGFTRTTLFGGLASGATMKVDDSIAYDYFSIGSIVDRYLETEDMYLGQYQSLGDDPMRQGVVLRMLLIYTFDSADPFEVGMSTDRGRTWVTRQVVPVDCGLSLIDWIVTGETGRFRFRENNANGRFRWSSYEYEWQDAGDYIGSGTCPTGIGATGGGPALHPSVTFTLSITLTSDGAPFTGNGSVVSDVGGISCPGTCSAVYTSGAIVMLTPIPNVLDAAQFDGWSGDVPLGQELDDPLTIVMNQNRTINCDFVNLG